MKIAGIDIHKKVLIVHDLYFEPMKLPATDNLEPFECLHPRHSRNWSRFPNSKPLRSSVSIWKRGSSSLYSSRRFRADAFSMILP